MRFSLWYELRVTNAVAADSTAGDGLLQKNYHNFFVVSLSTVGALQHIDCVSLSLSSF